MKAKIKFVLFTVLMLLALNSFAGCTPEVELPEENVIENADGSVTTIITADDGSTVSTTEYPDGKTIKETKKKDGSSVKITTEANGDKTTVTVDADGNTTIVAEVKTSSATTITTTKPDGTVVVEIKKADGSKETTTTHKSGDSETVKENASGEKTTITVEKKSDGSTVTTTTTPDKTVKTETLKADGSKVTVTKDTKGKTVTETVDTAGKKTTVTVEKQSDGSYLTTTVNPDGTTTTESTKPHETDMGTEPVAPDPVVPVDKTPVQMPVIRIDTLGASNPKYSNDNMAFVTKPVSQTPRIHQNDENYAGSSDLPWKELSKITVVDEYGDTVIKDAEANVNVRGNYTTTYEKKPLKINFAKKHNVLGLHNGEKFEKWVLLACWKDFSFLRDYTGLYLAKLMSDKYYASDCKLVEVYINENYWGVYLLAEQQESKRMGITVAKEGDGVVNTGYLFEYDSYADCVNDWIKSGKTTILGKTIEQDYFIIDPYSPTNSNDGGHVKDYLGNDCGYGKNVRGYSFKSKYDDEKKSFIKNYMNNVVTICREALENNNFYKFTSDYKNIVLDTSVISSKDCIEKIIDVDSFVCAYILCELAADPDLDWSSFYMSVDFGPEGNKKLTFQAPWDFDSAFGHKLVNSWDHVDFTKTGVKGLFAANRNTSKLAGGLEQRNLGNPWTVMLMQAPWMWKEVSDKWQSISGNMKDAVTRKITEISDDPINVAAFARNYEKWSNLKDGNGEVCPNASYPNVKNQKDAANFLIDWLDYRFNDLNTHLNLNNSQSNLYVSDSADIRQPKFKCWDKGYEEEITDNKSKFMVEPDSVNGGFKITKDHDDKYKRINLEVRDMTTGYTLAKLENIDRYDDNDSTRYKRLNTFVYPFTEAGHVYSLKLTFMTNNYKEWHAISCLVRANGGMGDFYATISGYTYNKAANTMTFTNYRSNIPIPAISENQWNYLAHLFKDQDLWNYVYVCNDYGTRWRFVNSNTIDFVVHKEVTKDDWQWVPYKWSESEPEPPYVSAVIDIEYKFKFDSSNPAVYKENGEAEVTFNNRILEMKMK